MRRGYATHCDGCNAEAVDRKESPDDPYTTPGLTDWLLVQQLDGGYEVRRRWAFCSWPCLARVASERAAEVNLCVEQ